MATIFGELFKKYRLANELSLREFCVKNGYDPGNISKLERGKLAPPQTTEKLIEYAQALGIANGSPEEKEFIDTGLTCAGQIPPDVLTDEELVARLPVLLRTISRKKLSKEQLDTLIDLIREA